MSTLHFLNVGPGDCIILEHASKRVTVYDICGGNRGATGRMAAQMLERAGVPTAPGNFRMCEQPTQPLDYLARYVGRSVFRFILSHPDMDHLDGFNCLTDGFNVSNFWHSGLDRDKPEFGDEGPFREEDWDRYEKVRDGNEPGTTSLLKRAGARFQYANRYSDGSAGGDGLYILAPDDGLVEAAHLTEDYNDASYVILYKSVGGHILIPGDAHDKTWEYVLAKYEEDVRDVPLLIAPHHGRKSGRDYGFLDVVRPKLTLFGCAPSDALAYDAWNYRNLTHITNNQAGSVVVECTDKRMSVYVENRRFAEAAGGVVSLQHPRTRFYFLGSLDNR